MSVFFFGCATASVGIPDYIKDVNPYKKKYYASLDLTKAQVQEVVADFNWVLTGESDPAIFETAKRLSDAAGEQVLLFYQYNQGKKLSKTTRLNIYLRTIDSTTTEVELRYLNIKRMPFKSFTTYRNDKVVEQIFTAIEDQIHR